MPVRWLPHAVRMVLAGWTAVVLTATHWPRPAVDLTAVGGDKAVHLMAYGIWGLLAGLSRPPGPRAAVRWLLLGLVLAALDELTQPLALRTAELRDWGADAAGVALGLLAASLSQQRSA